MVIIDGAKNTGITPIERTSHKKRHCPFLPQNVSRTNSRWFVPNNVCAVFKGLTSRLSCHPRNSVGADAVLSPYAPEERFEFQTDKNIIV